MRVKPEMQVRVFDHKELKKVEKEMVFDHSYFEDEVREGFYIPGMVKRSWAVQMEVLGAVADICKKHHIKWYAHCGTLLGAVRHGGFIPWDDDLDICMLRDDYTRFNEAARCELPKGYKILNLEQEPEYDMFLTRIVNGQSIDISNEYLRRNHGFPYVAGIDIFPLDYLIPDESMEEKRRLKAKTVWELVQSISAGEERRSEEEIADYIFEVTGVGIRRDMELQAALLRMLETFFMEYDGKDAACVAVMPYYINNRSHIYPLECFAESISIPFETGVISVPAAYDKVLQIEYGKWERVNKKGGFHDYPFFREQERLLVQKNGNAPYVYCFTGYDKGVDEERVRHALETDGKRQTLKQIDTLHSVVYDAMNKKDCPAAMNFLTECQNLAIVVGTGIEKDYGKGLRTVNLLEDYCEHIFNLYERLASGEKLNAVQEKKKLSKQVSRIRNSYDSDIKRPREILFMPVRARDWESLDGLYQDYMSEEDAIVSVMPLPYYEREDDGSPGTECYEYDDFPANLRLLRFGEYDFGHRHPDAIVIQNPFDEYASAMTVHPFFYARNIRKFTNELIYVQPFRTDEKETREKKAWTNISKFVVTPGVIYSDVVYVPSENMKKAYMDCLTGVMGKGSRGLLEKKLRVMRHYDETGRENVRERERGIILFYVSVADIYFYKGRAIEWIRNSLELFEAAKCAAEIVWISEDSANQNILYLCPEIYDDYLKTISLFYDKKLGKNISVKDVEHILHEADAYYGSGGYVMNLCARENIPIMLRRI